MERLTYRTIDGHALLLHGVAAIWKKADPGKYAVLDNAVDRLAAYEELMERWKLRSIEEADRIFHRVNALGGIDLMAQYRAIGSIDHLRYLLQSEKEGRLVVPPCAIGSEVFTIEESYFDCENCEHGAKAKYDPKINCRCCGLDDEHCPYHIEGHIVEGFTIGEGDAGKPSISAPGEWGCEGLETFSGIDGKWYPTREEAEAALAQKGGSND